MFSNIDSSLNSLADKGSHFLLFFVLFLVLSCIVFIINSLINKSLKKFQLPLLFALCKNIVIFVLIIMILLSSAYIAFGEQVVNNLLKGLGILGIVLGFTFKEVGENLISGILLALQTPFKQGDYIEHDGMVGEVLSISLRNTQIKTTDGKDVFIPNANLIKNTLISYTIDGYLRYGFIVGLEVGVDFDKAKAIIEQAVIQTAKVLNDDHKPNIYIKELKASTTDVQVNFWLNIEDYPRIPEHNRIRSDVMNNVVQALVKHDFYLPADIVEIKKLN